MESGRSHSRELPLVGLLAVHNSVAAGVVGAIVEAADNVAGAVDVVAVDVAVIVDVVAGPELLLAGYMPGMCSSTTDRIVLHSSFDLRILDIDS